MVGARYRRADRVGTIPWVPARAAPRAKALEFWRIAPPGVSLKTTRAA